MSLVAWTPIVAYLASCCGSALGLLCTERARIVSGVARRGWLILGAISIGGTGIWVMHFIAMLGMRMGGTSVGYNVPITLLSMLVAVVVVGVGLFVVNSGAGRIRSLLVGGLFTGVGVAGMHYVGMAAMSIQGTVRYDGLTVLLSVGWSPRQRRCGQRPRCAAPEPSSSRRWSWAWPSPGCTTPGSPRCA